MGGIGASLKRRGGDAVKRRVVIVGASSRTGRAIAAAIAEPECELVLGYFSGRDMAEACLQEVESKGGRATLAMLDFSLTKTPCHGTKHELPRPLRSRLYFPCSVTAWC